MFLLLPDWVGSDSPDSGPTEATPQVEHLQIEEPVATAVERQLPAPKNPPPAELPEVKEIRHEEPAEPRVATDPFALAMSLGLTALDEVDFTAAQEAFREADRLQPGSDPAREGLARAEIGLRQEALIDLRRRALLHVDREEWVQAQALYAQVLALDPAVEFAISGRQIALRRASLSQRLEDYLARPERLSSQRVLAEARAALDEAEEIQGAGSLLDSQRQRLDQLLDSYSTPVRARLSSDNETQVVVHRVGRLGTFENYELQLRPGRYTVVGSRVGYRDVRRTLIVEPGAEPATLVVRCEEEI